MSIPGSDDTSVLIALGDRDPGSELLAWLIEKPRQRAASP